MSSAPGPSEGFSFKTGDLVLVKWNDGMVYFAKIKKIDKKRRICIVVFDDKSQDEADFSQVHSGECGGRTCPMRQSNYLTNVPVPIVTPLQIICLSQQIQLTSK